MSSVSILLLMQGLTSYKEAQLSRRGRATHVDPTYVSPGDAWFDGSADMYSTMGSYWSNWCVRKGEVAPFAPKISHGKVRTSAPTVPTIFGVVSQRAELSR